MKYRYLLLCIVMSLVTIFSLSAQTTTNQNPVVVLTSPTNSIFSAPANIIIEATATDPDGTINRVVFYKNDDIILIDSVAPYTASLKALPVGNYVLRARAYDNFSASASSSRQIAVVSNTVTNQPPTVGFLSPTTSVFAPPATIKIEAAAYDSDGKVKKVEFFNNDVLIATDSVVPYTATLLNLPIGIYKIKIKATDDKNYASSVTREIKVQAPVVPNIAPKVNMTSPTQSTMLAPATVNLAATAADADGFIISVAFYKNDDLIKIDSVAPYTASLSNLPEGVYTLKAKATDNKGAIMTYSRPFYVVKQQIQNVPPSIKLEVVSNNNYQAPATLVLKAEAKDIDGTIKNVEFSYNGGGVVVDSIAPYVTDILNLAVGTYQITAKATDNKGVSTSTNITVNIIPGTGNQAPTVSLDIKQINTGLPATLSLKAEAKDVDGTVVKVMFFQDDTNVGVDSIAPYELTLPNVAAGTYVFKAKAIDNQNSFTRVAKQVTVGSTFSQNQLPIVKITAPNSNLFQGPVPVITISADASDPDGTIKRVVFYSGFTILAMDSIAPYTFDWKNVAPGSYSIRAQAIDNVGASATSSRYITVNAVTIPNSPPSIYFTAPASSSFLAPATIDLAAEAKDSDGKVVAVQFYLGDQLILSDSVAPYKAILTSLTAGQYQIKAKVTDDKGAHTTVIRSITVSVPQPINQYPTVLLTNPTTTLQQAPATMIVTANAKDVDGFVKKVVFFLNDDIIATDSVAPYSAAFPTLQIGQYNIRARAYDDKGYYSTTTRAIYVVNSLTNPQNYPPAIHIFMPKAQSIYKAPAEFMISCDAKDPDGKVNKVEFFQNDVLIGTDTTSLYEQKITGLAAGTYTFKIKATDDKGASSTTSVTIIANSVTPNFLAINTTATVFPNPFQSQLSLNVRGILAPMADVNILDMNGRVVYHTLLNVYDEHLEATLATDQLESGVYMLQIQTATQQIVQKIVKQ
jgi:major membrane immunogen (membrane-anchored lipoprotein)